MDLCNELLKSAGKVIIQLAGGQFFAPGDGSIVMRGWRGVGSTVLRPQENRTRGQPIYAIHDSKTFQTTHIWE
jgi:hypothetical protein